MIITLLLMGLLIVLGFVFINGKGSFLIAGYNTMSPEKKSKYDTVALSKFMGKATFALSFSMIFWVVSEVIEVEWLFNLGQVIFIGIILFMIGYMNTGNRFKK